MVLENYVAASSKLVYHIAKVYHWRLECHCVDSEYTEQAKFDWQDLVSSSDFDGDAHSEFFVLVNRRIFVLLDQKPTASL